MERGVVDVVAMGGLGTSFGVVVDSRRRDTCMRTGEAVLGTALHCTHT